LVAFAATALLLGVCVNARAPAGLPLWPVPGQRAAVPSSVWQKLQFADASAIPHGSGALLVDVREPGDYGAAHPPGAVNLPYRQFTNFKSAVKPRTRVYLYCYGGECSTSLRVASRLLQGGFTDVTIVRGGFEAWQSGGQFTRGGGAPGG
jgi:rhodanese-related sulfurtransferase